MRRQGDSDASTFHQMAAQLTDFNLAAFDAADGFAACIAGVHEVLRLQGLLSGIWRRPAIGAGGGGRPGVRDVSALLDTEFIAGHIDEWLG